MERALPSLKNRPILGHIVQLDDGSYDFFSHDFEVDEETGEVVYQEIPIGVTQDTENAHLEHDDERDVDFVMVDGVIWEEYGNQAADILRRKKGTKVSVELSISDLSFNSKEKYLEINDFFFSGITCLGTNPETGVEIKEGMEGARLDLFDFIEEHAEEEGGDSVEDQIRLEQEEIEEPVVEEIHEEEAEEISSAEEEPVAYELRLGEHTFKYSVSLNDKLAALSELVNTVYSESDNDWYGVTVYDDYLVMMGCWTGRAYRQSYSASEDTYTLTGDREEVFVNFLTKAEEDQLAEMRSNYDALVQYKANTEAAALRAEKEAILADEKYAVIADSNSFKALRDKMDNYSKEELAIRATALLGDHYATFTKKDGEKKKVGFENNPAENNEKKPYGNLFD